jgi:DNA polymerase V
MDHALITTVPVPLTVTNLTLPTLLGSACAGFLSPAEDLQEQSIDLSQVLITHPQATYMIRARGTSMTDAGIFDQDILVVNRALSPCHGQVVVAIVDNEFTIKYLHLDAITQRPCLKAANPLYPDLHPKEGQTLEIWGVVTAAIKQFR